MKHSTLTSMKFIRLKRRLGLPSYQVAGVLEMVWGFAIANAQDGGIGRFSNEDIAAWIEWSGDADELIKILIETGWIDSHEAARLVVHDWEQHCPNYIKGAMSKKGSGFLKPKPKLQAVAPSSEHEAKQQAKPDEQQAQSNKPSNLTKPNLTKPNQTIEANASCPETKKSSPGPDPEPESLLSFPCDGNPGVWNLIESQVSEWSKLFPSLDILAECRKALAWSSASPDRRKTSRGMKRFLVSWLTRATDNRRSQPAILPISQRDRNAALHAEATARVMAGGPASPIMAAAYESKRAIEALKIPRQPNGGMFDGE